MNLPINPAMSAVFSADLHVSAAMFSASRELDCPVCPALAGDECVHTTAPVRPVHGYHAARLDAAGADLAGVLGATAVVWDNGDAPRLPAAVAGDGEHDAARDVLYVAKEKLDNLGALMCELASALGSREQLAELLDEDQDLGDIGPSRLSTLRTSTFRPVLSTASREAASGRLTCAPRPCMPSWPGSSSAGMTRPSWNGWRRCSTTTVRTIASLLWRSHVAGHAEIVSTLTNLRVYVDEVLASEHRNRQHALEFVARELDRISSAPAPVLSEGE